MKKYAIVLIALGFALSFMFIQCSDTITSLEDQQAQLDALNKNGSGTESDDDSDRPPWAGDPEKNPNIGKNPDSGTKKGDKYGDLYIILRHENGEPDLTSDGFVQPIAFETNPDGTVRTDEEGLPVEALSGDELILFDHTAEGDIIPIEGLSVCEVDFGRINLVRAPSARLDQALEEAVGALKRSDVARIYLDFCGRLTAEYLPDADGVVTTKTIDSPRENMAIYRELMSNGFDVNLSFLAGQFSVLELAASAFAAGSDKTGHVIVDEVVYCNEFLKLNDFSYDHYYSYSYNRDVYKNRYIRMKLVNGEYDEEREPISIYDAFEAGHFKFTTKWGMDESKWIDVEGFHTAADDAVQVLEFIHGDSNIEYLPDYTP